MKPARHGVTLRFANVGGVWGEIVSHLFINDSSAPICMPAEPGPPGIMHEAGGTWSCDACSKRVTRAYWATTSFGKQRLWVVSFLDDFTTERIRSSGMATTDADAFEQATAALEKLLPKDAPTILARGSEAHALKLARERRADERMKKRSDATGAQLVEYVYRHDKEFHPPYLSTSFTWRTRSYKILRKTPKLVFVEDVAGTYETESGGVVLKTYAIARRDLEREAALRFGWTLNPSPPAGPDGSSTPGWAVVLGVSMPCTLTQAKRAFRSAAKTAHPDNGGTAEAFRQVKEAFDAAAQQLGGAA